MVVEEIVSVEKECRYKPCSKRARTTQVAAEPIPVESYKYFKRRDPEPKPLPPYRGDNPVMLSHEQAKSIRDFYRTSTFGCIESMFVKREIADWQDLLKYSNRAFTKSN